MYNITTLHSAYVNARRNVVPADIKVKVEQGIGIHVVGLPDHSTKECLLRICTALQSCGYNIPGRKIVVEITPNVPIELISPTDFDLPIAIGILNSSEQIKLNMRRRYTICGELGLDGTIRPTFAPRNVAEEMAKYSTGIVLQSSSALEALPAVQKINLYAVRNLHDAIDLLCNPLASEDYFVDNCYEYLTAGQYCEERWWANKEHNTNV